MFCVTADVLDGLNRYPELKKIIAKTRGNIKNPKKHFNYFVSGIAEFQKATDSSNFVINFKE